MNGLFVALLILCLSFGEVAEENGILLLNDDNFNQVVKENKLMFIEFYSSVVPVPASEM